MSTSIVDQITNERTTTHSSAEPSAFQERMAMQDGAASQEMKQYEAKLILTLLNNNHRSAEKPKNNNSLDQRNQNSRTSGGLGGSQTTSRSYLLKAPSRCLQDEADQYHHYKAFEPKLLGRNRSALDIAQLYRGPGNSNQEQAIPLMR